MTPKRERDALKNRTIDVVTNITNSLTKRLNLVSLSMFIFCRLQ